MKSEFSEFSYGYAVVEDVLRREGRTTTAPEFPSLIDEGGKGYDVRLNVPGIPVFLQFKLSDCLVRRNATEARQGILNVPFYRMYLRTAGNSRQHELLMDLQSQGNRVYYVAPGFHRDFEFNTTYQHQAVLTKSILFEPNSIGPLSNGDHHISFQNATAPNGWLFSEKGRELRVRRWQDISTILTREVRRLQTPLETTLHQLEDQMVRLLSEYMEDKGDWQTIFDSRLQENLLRRVAFFSRIFFDCTMFVIGRPD